MTVKYEVVDDILPPDWVPSPGEILQSILDARRLSRLDLAISLDRPVEFVDDLISGKISIGVRLVFHLADVVGMSPAFWLRREDCYRSQLRRLNQEAQ
jgi:HTH-type transcriptional regulator/antitoxin HigA